MRNNRILVITKNWLGDVVMETPALRAIHRRFPDSEIFCAGPGRVGEILKALPYVSGFIPFDERIDPRVAAKWRFVREVRRLGFIRAFLFHRSWTRALLTALGGVPSRIGYATKGRRWLLTQAVEEPREEMHHVDYFLELLARAGFPADGERVCEFAFGRQDEEKVARLLAPHLSVNSRLVVFHTGANWAPKRWAPEKFARLADLLAARRDALFVLTGSSEDEELARRVQSWGRVAQMVVLCGRTTLAELGALFKRADLVVSNDSGPMHIAAGVRAPLVALFGPTRHELTGPRGAGHTLIFQQDPQCAFVIESVWHGAQVVYCKRLEPELVAERAERLLAHPVPQPLTTQSV